MNVSVGDKVSEGQVVAAVEAMKAKHEVRAPRDGVVTHVHVSIGDEVFGGKPIITIEQ